MNAQVLPSGDAHRPLLFIGLVTHPNTRFGDSRGDQGLVRSLERLLPQSGVDVTVAIHDENLFSTAVVPLSRDEVRASIAAELDVEKRWRFYLDPSLSPLRLRGVMTIRAAYRRLKYSPPWRRMLEPTDAGPAMLRRLVNIELAHTALMQAAVEAGASWALLVEDDASADASLLAGALTSFMRSQANESQPLFVNVSRSFDQDSLGIGDSLTEVGDWDDGSDRKMFAAQKAATNTVCAVLYRTTFLVTLLEEFRDIPLSPVVPIDWKLNEAILRLHADGRLSPGDCWFVDPPPIRQRSMD